MNQSEAITPRLARYVKPYKMLKDPVARFLSRVEKTDGCWFWTGKLGTAGYGEYWLSRRPHGAHRVAWTLFKGPITNGLCVLHRCDVRRCVNPEHLFLGTSRENTLDKVFKGRQPAGGKCWNAISPTLIESIIAAAGPQSEIAKRFGVSTATVYQIKSRRHWYFRQRSPEAHTEKHGE